MKKAIKLTAILCALVLLMGLAGCDDKAAQTPKYETITVEMPEQQADVAGEKIIKADWTIYSLWMLTDEHNLYGCFACGNKYRCNDCRLGTSSL